MCYDNLLEHCLFSRDVPYLKRSSFGADKNVVNINLVEVSWTVFILECLLDCLRSGLDVDVDNDDF